MSVSSDPSVLSPSGRAARGKAARGDAPRSGHAGFEPAGDRPDPIEVLERQARTRLPELVPVRYGRMLVSPLTFFRGSAAIMAHDLAPTPRPATDPGRDRSLVVHGRCG